MPDCKTICVVVTNQGDDATTLAVAAGMALAEDAHLDVHCIGIDPIRYDSMTPVGGTIILESGIAEAREQADRLLRWATAALPPELVKVALQTIVAPQMGLETTVARLARYADLFIAAKPYGAGHSPLQAVILEAALFGAGVPIIVVPDAGFEPSQPFSRIMIAWNDSDEAFSAVRKALPWLKAAQHVDVVMVDPDSHAPERSDPGGALSLLLARHGIRPEVTILARSLPRVSQVLCRFVQDQGVNAVVMGGYGHSRFREAILGGATRDMLEIAVVPLIIAH